MDAASDAQRVLAWLFEIGDGDGQRAGFTLTTALQMLHASLNAEGRGEVEARCRRMLGTMYEIGPRPEGADHLEIKLV